MANELSDKLRAYGENARWLDHEERKALMNEAAKRIDEGILTLNEAGLLGDLIRAVERGLKVRYYALGAGSDGAHMNLVLRAFTIEGGGFYPVDADVRDAFIWCSGFFERWIKVSDLILALDNLDGKHGETNPIAIIDYEGTL